MNQKLQLIENWLFPEQTETEKLDYEQISNKKFMFMSVLGISVIILCKLILEWINQDSVIIVGII